MSEDITGREAAEHLAALHTALSRCCVAWRNLYRHAEPVTVTAGEALELADWFARCADEVAATATLLGFVLMAPPPDPEPRSGPAKHRLLVFEGGKTP